MFFYLDFLFHFIQLSTFKFHQSREWAPCSALILIMHYSFAINFSSNFSFFNQLWAWFSSSFVVIFFTLVMFSFFIFVMPKIRGLLIILVFFFSLIYLIWLFILCFFLFFFIFLLNHFTCLFFFSNFQL